MEVAEKSAENFSSTRAAGQLLRTDDGWHVEIDGDVADVPHQPGWSYIDTLIRHQGQYLDASQVVTLAGGAVPADMVRELAAEDVVEDGPSSIRDEGHSEREYDRWLPCKLRQWETTAKAIRDDLGTSEVLEPALDVANTSECQQAHRAANLGAAEVSRSVADNLDHDIAEAAKGG